jgi:beta-glucosidase
MERDIAQLVSQLTLEEKAGLCSGLDFWHTKPVERLGIPSVMVSDGPHGLRKQDLSGDHLGFNDSIKAVCFPAGSALACSFDRDLARQVGETLGDECQSENVSVLLGPAVNIKRSPLCGRNFEYLSEDPYLASEIAAAHIKGVQSKNVGTSIKHFAANNQEFRRMTSSSELDERAFREIYLAAFETAIREGKPDTVMCSYNKINGVYASENRRLLTEILRDEWGFEGYVMSDWGAVNDRVAGLRAGLDLEMPSSNGATDADIVAAVKSGDLDEAVLDTAVARILRIVFKFVDGRQSGNFDRTAHHALAAKISEECVVLLKNSGALPLKKEAAGSVAFIGLFAKEPRYQGGGSSHINSATVTSALDACAALSLPVKYAQGYRTDTDAIDQVLIDEAVNLARSSSSAVVFAGLPDSYESEGYDRAHLRMPECQNELIRRVAAVQPNTVVVLHNGSPVEMPWIGGVNAVLEAYLGGEAVGTAVARILFGLANPSGHLAESFPNRLEDTPTSISFPGDGRTAEYREGVFVGYRYYDRKKMDVLFPFGHGLSYTTFEYSDLMLDRETMSDTDELTVSLTVKNTGAMAGKAVVQFYVADRTAQAIRPERELKNFAKVALQPGESARVSIKLGKRAFAWYSPELGDWYAGSGEYDVLVGSSSRDLRLSATVRLVSSARLPFAVTRETPFVDIMNDPRARPVFQPILDRMASVFSAGADESSKAAISDAMIAAMIENFPLRSLRSFSGMPSAELDALIAELNAALR